MSTVFLFYAFVVLGGMSFYMGMSRGNWWYLFILFASIIVFGILFEDNFRDDE